MKRRPLDPLIEAGHRFVGRLPIDWQRRLIIIDGALAVLIPVLWAAFIYRRWLGEWPKSLGWHFWLRGMAYMIARVRHPSLAVMAADPYFGQEAVAAAAVARERADWATPGRCDGCAGKHCCKIPRGPGKEPAPCPLLDDRTQLCRVYDGIYWNVGPCGRYPQTQASVDHYGCPRFHFPAEVARPAAVARRRLPIISR